MKHGAAAMVGVGVADAFDAKNIEAAVRQSQAGSLSARRDR